MKKENRLRKNRDFQTVINKGKRLVGKNLVVYYKPNNVLHTQVGLSVSKKFGNAVFRNAVRRQMRPILDDELRVKSSKDIVMIIRKPFANLTYVKKRTEIRAALQKIHAAKTPKVTKLKKTKAQTKLGSVRPPRPKRVRATRTLKTKRTQGVVTQKAPKTHGSHQVSKQQCGS